MAETPLSGRKSNVLALSAAALFELMAAELLRGTLAEFLTLAARHRGVMGNPAAPRAAGRQTFPLSDAGYASLMAGENCRFSELEEVRGGRGASHAMALLDIAVARRFPLADLEPVFGMGFLPGPAFRAAVDAAEASVQSSDARDYRKRAAILDHEVFAARAELKAEEAYRLMGG